MSDPFAALPPKSRTPQSGRVLDGWISDAGKLLGATGDRTRWILASTIVATVLQRAVDGEGVPLFLVKGGLYIERALDLKARATKDLDSVYRGAVADFEEQVNEVIAEDWGPITLTRTQFETVENEQLSIKPKRFDMQLDFRGKRWARIPVEVSFAEGKVGDHHGSILAPSTQFFGLDQPADIATITMAYQIAQKIHACTDPHDPPERAQLRVRDIVDLNLIKDAYYPDAADLAELRAAAIDIFAAREAEARKLGRSPRAWPPVVTTNDQWIADWAKPADAVGMAISLDQAIANINEWVTAIDGNRRLG
jgi:Nucleotidyl transferase AbiEii toxin, Type IV TA system